MHTHEAQDKVLPWLKDVVEPLEPANIWRGSVVRLKTHALSEINYLVLQQYHDYDTGQSIAEVISWADGTQSLCPTEDLVRLYDPMTCDRMTFMSLMYRGWESPNEWFINVSLAFSIYDSDVDFIGARHFRPKPGDWYQAYTREGRDPRILVCAGYEDVSKYGFEGEEIIGYDIFSGRSEGHALEGEYKNNRQRDMVKFTPVRKSEVNYYKTDWLDSQEDDWLSKFEKKLARKKKAAEKKAAEKKAAEVATEESSSNS